MKRHLFSYWIGASRRTGQGGYVRSGALIITFVALLGLGLDADSQSLGGLTLTKVETRILTPNGDARNDVVFFKFDSTLLGFPIESSIFDINGSKIAGLRLNLNDTALSWDGKDDSGRVAPAGIYVYSIKIGRNLASGTIVVAR